MGILNNFKFIRTLWVPCKGIKNRISTWLLMVRHLLFCSYYESGYPYCISDAIFKAGFTYILSYLSILHIMPLKISRQRVYVTYGWWKTVKKNYFDKASEELFLKSFSLLPKAKDYLKISIIYSLYTAIYLLKYRKSTQLHQEKSFAAEKD